MAKSKLSWPLTLNPKQQAELAEYLAYRISVPPEERAGMGHCILCGGDHPAPSPKNCVVRPAPVPAVKKSFKPLTRPSGNVMGKQKSQPKEKD